MTDLSVPEAFPLSDFDEAAVKSGYAAALKEAGSADAADAAAGQIQVRRITLALTL